MLHGGLSMAIFKEWCENEKNTLIIPGYCVAGTLGNKLLSGA
jgi:integrator complex subunit 11